MARQTQSAPVFKQVTIRSREQWRAWLTNNHTQTESIWLVIYKKGKGPSVRYDDIVEEALCFGWVDSRPSKLDDARSMLLLSPRKATSAWSKLNKDRVKKLEAQGLMTPAGRKKIERAKANGLWDKLNDVDALKMPVDLVEAFKKNQKAFANFETFARSSQRGILEWITNAKKPETRANRIEETVRLAARNIKANHPEGRNINTAKPKPRIKG
jgi:uncharacterized protein YdeI (YjbR/CyaY-like superfamily)